MFAVLLALSFVAPVFANEGPIEMPSPVSDVYVPIGFDSNDNVEIVLAGEFPSSCYKVGLHSFRVTEKNEILIQATTLFYPGSTCAQVITPFMQIVKIGVLKVGAYKVIVNDKSTPKKEFEIAQHLSEAPDDYLYAPVEFAEIETSSSTGIQYLEIQGRFPLMLIGCAYMQEVKINRDDPDVVVVQPIMAITYDCADHKVAFKQTVPLTSPFSGKGLIHVRVLNGISYNKLINL